MSNYSDEKLNKIWEKAKIVNEENDKKKFRKDFAGAWIKKDEYGKESDYGWEVDHIKPSSKSGSDELSNLNPLHWKNNRTKGDDYPKFDTSVSSKENKNIEKKQSWKI